MSSISDNTMDPQQSNRLWLEIIDSVEDRNFLRVQQLWETFQSEQSNHESVVIEALVNYQHEIARWLIQNGANVNAQLEAESLTPLFWAIHLYDDVDDVQTIQMLLEYGANVNVKDRKGLTPLHWTCRSKVKKAELLVEAAKLLIENGADLHAKDNKFGNTPFFWACRNRSFEVAKMLIDKGVSVDDKDDFGMTALHRACKAGNLDAVKFLLAHGADVRMKARQDKKLLLIKWLVGTLYRLTHGPIGMVLLQLQPNIRIMVYFFVAKLLAHCANECIKKTRIGPTPLYFACENNRLDLVWFMVRQEPWRVERGVEGWERRAGVKKS